MGRSHELERNDAKELFEAAGGRVLKTEKELEDKFNEKLERVSWPLRRRFDDGGLRHGDLL